MYFSRVLIQPKVFKTTQLAKVMSDNIYSQHRLLWDLFSDQTQRPFLYREEIAREQLGTKAGIKGEPVFYVVSSTLPLTKSPIFSAETREYKPKFRKGEQLRFELRANPVVTRNRKKHDIVMDAQQQFLKTLCTDLNLKSYLSNTFEKKDLKRILLDHGGHALDNRLTAILENDSYFAERLDYSMTLYDKLEWSLKSIIDASLNHWVVNQGKKRGFSVLKDKEGCLKIQNSSYQWHEIGQNHKNKMLKSKKSGFSSVDFSGDLEVIDVELFKKTLFEGIGRSKSFGCGLMLVRRI